MPKLPKWLDKWPNIPFRENIGLSYDNFSIAQLQTLANEFAEKHGLEVDKVYFEIEKDYEYYDNSCVLSFHVNGARPETDEEHATRVEVYKQGQKAIAADNRARRKRAKDEQYKLYLELKKKFEE